MCCFVSSAIKSLIQRVRFLRALSEAAFHLYGAAKDILSIMRTNEMYFNCSFKTTSTTIASSTHWTWLCPRQPMGSMYLQTERTTHLQPRSYWEEDLPSLFPHQQQRAQPGFRGFHFSAEL